MITMKRIWLPSLISLVTFMASAAPAAAWMVGGWSPQPGWIPGSRPPALEVSVGGGSVRVGVQTPVIYPPAVMPYPPYVYPYAVMPERQYVTPIQVNLPGAEQEKLAAEELRRRQEEAYQAARAAKIKKLESKTGRKVKSWQVLHR